MIIRRNLLQGLAAIAASIPLSSHSALSAADSGMRRARRSMEYLEACVIACEGSKDLGQDINPIDFWTFMLGNVGGATLPEGCRKVVIFDNDLSPDRIVQDVAHLYRSIPKYYGFDPLETPHHCALHVEGITDFHEQIRFILSARSAKKLMSKIAVIDIESACFYLSIDWPAILPTLCSHYDHVIAISTVGEDEESEFDDPEFVSYWRKREEMIAGYCDAVVKIPCPDFSDGEDGVVNHVTTLTCEITNAVLRKTPAEIFALSSCGVIPFRDFMALVA